MRINSRRVFLWVLIAGLVIFNAREFRTWASAIEIPMYAYIEYWSAARLFLDGANPYSDTQMLQDQRASGLARFGTLRFADVLQPAIELAENGFPIYEGLREHLVANREKYLTRYPTTGELYLPGGRVPEVGQVWRNPDWAKVLKRLCAAEAAAVHKGRTAGIEAARDAFYTGEIAEQMISFITGHPLEDASGSAHTGLLTCRDLAEWRASNEEPVSLAYGDLTVHKCPTWTQGPVILQQLALLAEDDLQALGHNSVEYPMPESFAIAMELAPTSRTRVNA